MTILRIKFIPILFFTISLLIGNTYKGYTQGWTFTFQLAQSGPCGGSSLPVLPTFPNFGFPTQNQCEALRQIVVNTKQSFPVTGDHGQIIGYCTIYYSCTPCTGSDIVTPGQTNPGDVSLNGQAEGNPFFTPHSSEAFEDWARDYKTLLESYGITSILGNNILSNPFLLSGDKNLDTLYTHDSENFNPPATVDSGVYIGGSRVANSMDDLLNKKVVIPGESTPADRTAQEEWVRENTPDLSSVSASDGLDENIAGGRSFKDAALSTLIEDMPGSGTIGAGLLKMVDVVFGEDGLPKVTDQVIHLDYQGGVETANNMQEGIRNATVEIMTQTIKNSFTEGISGALNAGIMHVSAIGERGEKAVEYIVGAIEHSGNLYDKWKGK